MTIGKGHPAPLSGSSRRREPRQRREVIEAAFDGMLIATVEGANWITHEQ
jgi:hypothetical protein